MEASEIVVWTFTLTGTFIGIGALAMPPSFDIPKRKRKAPRKARRG